jgi:hypothetical protein
MDTINNVMYTYIASKGGWKFNNSDTVIIQGVTMPFDSITFNTAKDGTVGVGEVEYNDTQGSLIQGLKGGNVTNVIGQQLHQRVSNKTGGTLAKGTAVYLSGSQGNRITVAKALATSDPTSANTFGIVAEEILDNATGYVITEGLITNINTSSLTQDSAVYLSGTTAGALTSTKPQAPIHGVYIGVCVKTNAGSGELFIKIRNGQELDELHDVQITSPVNNASLYYKLSEGIWRDTTASLLVSDTSSMLSPYFRDSDTSQLNLNSRLAAKLNISDTASMLTNYLRTGVAASTYLPLTGGTLSGASSDNNYTDTLLNVNYQFIGLPNNQNVTGIVSNVNTNGVNAYGIISDASTIYNTAIGIKGKSTHTDVGGPGIAYGVIGEISASGSGSLGTTYAGYFNNTSTVGGNHYGLYVNTASGGDYGIYQTGSGTNYFGSNTTIGGTFGITGATTMTGALTVNNSAVFNEGSTDSDFRVESDGNANMVFVDASTDRVGIGYASPNKTLDVNGTLGVFGATTLSNTLTVDGKAILNDSARFEGNVLFKKNMGLPIVKISNADYTATTTNHTIIYTTLTADKTLTIPNAADAVGVKFVISIFDIPEGNEALTLVTPGSNLFVRTDGENSSVDIVGGFCTTIQSDGTKWYILSYAPMY